MPSQYIIARQLSGKKMITNDGEDFGRLVDININELTGKIEHLIVEPNPDSESAAKMKKEDGMVHVPYESVTAVGDYVIVEKRNLVYE
jgi:sporulation protein YlmC with PRC-barrel domain